MPVPRGLLNILQTLLLLLPLVLLLTISVYLLFIPLMLEQVAFLAATLIYFCPCHAVAYLAAPVVAKNKQAKLSVKYPAFTDPPGHTEILQIIRILQIVQTASRFLYRSFRSHRFHSGR